MRAKEFITELMIGPSGIHYPQGFEPSLTYGGMHPTNKRFSDRARISVDYGIKPEELPINDHIKVINDRIKGGMSKEQSIKAHASKFGMSSNELMKLLDRIK